MNLQHEPINDWCVLFQIRSGVNTPVPQDATAKGNTNYFEEQQYQLKVTSSVNVSEMSLTQWWNLCVETYVKWSVPGRVGSVTNSTSRDVQNEIVASAENLGRVGGKFGRVREKFGRVGEKVWTRRREFLDASAVNLVLK